MIKRGVLGAVCCATVMVGLSVAGASDCRQLGLQDFTKAPVSSDVLIGLESKVLENMVASLLGALLDPKFVIQFKKTATGSILESFSKLGQTAGIFVAETLRQQCGGSLDTRAFTIFTPGGDSATPEFVNLYEKLLSNSNFITPTIEEYFYEIRDMKGEQPPFERFVALCGDELGNVSENRRRAVFDFLRGLSGDLREFSDEISLELIGTGAWEDDIVIEFKEFIDGRSARVERLLG